MDPLDGSTRPAARAVGELLERVSPALDRLGDIERVHRSVSEIMRDGNGAYRQRAAFARRHAFADVIDLATVRE